jgi:N-acetylneuraminic acid mutarotase
LFKQIVNKKHLAMKKLVYILSATVLCLLAVYTYASVTGKSSYEQGTFQNVKLPVTVDQPHIITIKGKYYVITQGNFLAFRQKSNYAELGAESDSTPGTIYEFIPTTALFKKIADIPAVKCYFGTAFLNNKIYIAGGYNTQWKPTNELYTFDLEKKSWGKTTYMSANRSRMALEVVKGKLYALYGEGSNGECEVYTPETSKWDKLNTKTIPAKLTPVNECSASATIDNSIYIFSSFGKGFYEYSTSEGILYERALPPFKTDFFDALVVNKKIYIAGGSQADTLDANVYKYDSNDGLWVNVGQINVPRCKSGLMMYGGMLMFLGGSLTDISKPLSITDDLFIYMPSK